MTKVKKGLGLVLGLALLLAGITGCTANEEFTYSSGIDDNGYWNRIKALKYVDLCEYQAITIPKDVHEITDESVQAEIDGILASYSTENQIEDRAVADGDTVNIDYVGSIDGVAFEGGSTEGEGTEVTIGVTQYIDDFLEQLIGHSPGESFDIEVSFPEDYGNDELNGKDAVFAITLNYIVELVPPEMTDAFVSENLSSYYGWNSIDEMKTGIRDELQQNAISDYVQTYIVENTTVNSLPDKLLKYQEDSMIFFYQGYADQYGMEFDDFLSTYLDGVTNTEDLLTRSLEDNTDAAEFYLIMQAIAEDAGITVTDDDLSAFFTEYVDDLDNYSQYEETYGKPYLKMATLHQSVMDYILNNTVLE